MEIVISGVFFLAIVVFLRIQKFFHSGGLQAWVIPVAFAIKCAVGLFFLQFYIFQHEDAHLKNDAGAFYHEAQILNSVYDESPSDYFKLISGIGATEELSLKYLGETNHWDSGKQAVFHDNRNIIRAHALVDFISVGSIIVHMLVFSLLSLIGTYLLFLVVQQHSELKPLFIFALLLLLPNLLFWSSGLLKEPFIVFGIGALAYGIGLKQSLSRRILFTGLGLFALVCFKPYILIALLSAGFVYVIYSLAPKHKLIAALGIPLILGCLFVLTFPSVVDKGTHRLSRKQFDFSNVGRGGVHVRYAPDSVFYYFTPEQTHHLKIEGDSVWLTEEIDAFHVKLGDLAAPIPVHLTPNEKAWRLHFQQDRANSFIEIPSIEDKPIRLITSAPNALLNTFFRPFPNDPGGKLKYLAFLETLFLFSLLLIAIIQRRSMSSKEKGFILSAIVFCVLLGLLIGWTTPVLGAIHRYRLPIQLAMLCCTLIIWKPKLKLIQK